MSLDVADWDYDPHEFADYGGEYEKARLVEQVEDAILRMPLAATGIVIPTTSVVEDVVNSLLAEEEPDDHEGGYSEESIERAISAVARRSLVVPLRAPVAWARRPVRRPHRRAMTRRRRSRAGSRAGPRSSDDLPSPLAHSRLLLGGRA